MFSVDRDRKNKALERKYLKYKLEKSNIELNNNCKSTF
ncbi:hypothetical protein CKA32_003796 [Geitlerinema sp. FC II]|nr:hypothetical protein CKA32_003796 [Geitlerinema sp. FC II]